MMKKSDIYALAIELVKTHNGFDVSDYSKTDLAILIANLEMALRYKPDEV